MRPTKCPACDGQGFLMGSLGRMKHYRCRDCGSTYSKKARKVAPRKKARKVAPRKTP